MDTTGSGGHDALTVAERARLAAAIRGPVDRFDVDGAEWYADLRADGLPDDVALLLVEAFGRERKPSQLELFSDGGEV